MGDILQNKIQDADFSGRDVTSIEGNVVAGQAEWLKQRFDSSVKDVIAPKYNALIDDLAAVTAAGQIGAMPLLPGGAATVGGQLSYLKDELNGIVLSQIPDGTVTDEKLSGGEGQVKARLLAVEQDKAPLNSPALTGEPTSPTAASGDSSAKLANTAYVQGELNILRNEFYPLGMKQNLQGENVDFNTLVNSGTYTWHSNAHIQACSNAPESSSTKAGTLTVDYILGQNNLRYVSQTFRDYLSSEWRRNSSDYGATWGDWIKIINETEIQSGSFTPRLYNRSDGTYPSYTYSRSVGLYWKLGKLVYISVYISGVKNLPETSRAGLAGLPYVCEDSLYHAMSIASYYDLFTSHADGDPVTAQVVNGKSYIAFMHTRGGNSAVFKQSAQNGILSLSGCYITTE